MPLRLVDATAEDFRAPPPAVADGTAWQQPGEDDEQGFYSANKLKQQYIDYLSGKQSEIEEQKEARRYYHGSMWTEEEIRVLRSRRQPVVTYNKIAKKVNGTIGLLERLRQDPKAYARKPRNEEGAEVATATIRYVLDTNDWQTKSSEAGRHAGIDGISGVELKLREGDKGDPDVQLEIVFGDDFFYDPRSFRWDFHDARWMGIAKWVDEEEAIELFRDKEDLIRSMIDAGTDITTNADREFKWVYVNTRRIRLVEHWYKCRSKWMWAFYINDTILDQGVSPFLNERAKTIPRFVMFSAAVDHDGDRYGFVRNYKGPQDEINQRRSKALHISNSRRLIMEKGAVDDVEIARREWARPDGVIEKNPGLDVKPDETQADLAAQFQFLQEAKAEIDQAAPASPVLPGQEAVPRNTSGRAINLLQQAGTAELAPFIIAYRNWKIRVYRVVWSLCQRYWTAERWIRVTDDQKVAQFIQLNGLELDQWGRPQLVNAVGQIDVDIILDEGPDTVNMMADAYDVLTEALRNGAQIPPQAIIELMPLSASFKKRILEMMNQPDPILIGMKQATLQKTQAEGDEKQASAMQKRADAMSKVAQSAHLASMAHLNAQEAYATGAQQAQGQPQQQPQMPQLPSGPQNDLPAAAPPPVTPQQLPLPFFAGQVPQTGVPQGARRAPDGNHYVPDPNRPGKYLMVVNG